MRVLWLSHLVPYPPKGGVQQRSYHLLREAARRHRVDFVGLAQPAHQETSDQLDEARSALSKFCESVRCFWLPLDRRFGFAGRLFLLARSLFTTRPYDVLWLASSGMTEYLSGLDRAYDLVHVDTLGLTRYVEAIRSVPFVLNHHNIESQMMADRAAKEPSRLKRLYLKREAQKLDRWERKWTPRAALNLVVSSLDDGRLKQSNPEIRTRIVRNGVDIEYFRPRTPIEEHDGSLIFVGGMSWYPNRDAVLWFVREIWPQLLADDPAYRVTVIGRNPPEEVLELARDDRFRAPGFVDDVRPDVDRSLAYLCPIRTGGGTRLKVLDALAMAKPLVATEFAVQGLGLKENVHYLRADTPDEFSTQVRRLAADDSLRRRLAHEGRALVEEKYAWEKIGDDMAEAYSEALET